MYYRPKDIPDCDTRIRQGERIIRQCERDLERNCDHLDNLYRSHAAAMDRRPGDSLLGTMASGAVSRLQINRDIKAARERRAGLENTIYSWEHELESTKRYREQLIEHKKEEKRETDREDNKELTEEIRGLRADLHDLSLNRNGRGQDRNKNRDRERERDRDL